MGPKKSKKGQGPDEDADKVQILNHKVQALQKQLGIYVKNKSNNNKLQTLVEQVKIKLNKESCILNATQKAKNKKWSPQCKSYKIQVQIQQNRSAMTHQYKQMQKQYNDELQSLGQKLIQRQQELKRNNEQIAATKKQQDEKLKNKQNQILQLKKRIEDMSNQFATMLKDTLQKMQQRIKLAEWDNDNDPTMIKKIKEMNTLT